MNEEQLRKGNDLTRKIDLLERSNRDIKKVLKRIDLEDKSVFDNESILVRIENIECLVSKERMCKFLWIELESVNKEISDCTFEFESL